MPHAQAAFPILTIEEIISGCAAVGCAILESDFRQPVPARIQAVYETWMAHSLGINAEDCIRAVEDHLAQMEHADIYREALLVQVFYRTFQQLALQANMEDVSPKDFFAPTEERVRYILSGLINFQLFEAEQHAELLIPLVEETEQDDEREEFLVKQTTELKDKIQAERERRKKNEPRLEQAQADEKFKSIEIGKKVTESKGWSKKVELAKAERDEAHLNLKPLAEENTRLSREIHHLKSQLISSPDRLKATVIELQNLLSREQEDLKAIESKERHQTHKIKSLVKYETELTSCIKVLDEWEIDVNKLKQAEIRLTNRHEQIEALTTEQEELQAHISILQRRIQNAREEIARFDDKTARKKAANKQKKRSLEEVMIQLVDKKKLLDMSAAAKTKEAIELEEEIRAIHKETHSELDRGKIAYDKIKNQVETYSLRLNKALDAITSLNQVALNLSA